MDDYIQISKINDFIFCPFSIYLHSMYEGYSESVFHTNPQKVGKIRHESIEKKDYSTSKNIIQGMSIYSKKYNIIGKLDLYNSKSCELIERKYRIKKIFDGYKYQLYAEYFCLIELGFKVKRLSMHSLVDNKKYLLDLPDDNETKQFEDVLKNMRGFDVSDFKKISDQINTEKCQNCIYNILCIYNKNAFTA